MGEDGVAAAVQGLSLDGGATFPEIVNAKKPYYSKRVELFEQYRARDVAAVEAAKAANVPITVVLPDGAKKSGVKDVTTPLDVANEISKSLAKKVVVAKVDGEVWDLFRPLEGDCSLSLHNFDDPEGKEVRPAAAVTSTWCVWPARACNSSSRAVAVAVAMICSVHVAKMAVVTMHADSCNCLHHLQQHNIQSKLSGGRWQLAAVMHATLNQQQQMQAKYTAGSSGNCNCMCKPRSFPDTLMFHCWLSN
jgi:hypothetical protein